MSVTSVSKAWTVTPPAMRSVTWQVSHLGTTVFDRSIGRHQTLFHHGSPRSPYHREGLTYSPIASRTVPLQNPAVCSFMGQTVAIQAVHPKWPGFLPRDIVSRALNQQSLAINGIYTDPDTGRRIRVTDLRDITVPHIAPDGLQAIATEYGGIYIAAGYDPGENAGRRLALWATLPNHFGLIQDVTGAAIEAGVGVLGIESRYDSAIPTEEAVQNPLVKPIRICRQVVVADVDQTLTPAVLREIFTRFQERLEARLTTRAALSSEGEKVLASYPFIRAIAGLGESYGEWDHEELIQVLIDHPEFLKGMIRYLRLQSDFDIAHAEHQHNSGERRDNTLAQLRRLASASAPDKRPIFDYFIRFIQSVQQTNAFDYHRDLDAVVFSLDDSLFSDDQLAALEIDRDDIYDMTYGYNLTHGSFCLSPRFVDPLSKGGLRYYLTSLDPRHANFAHKVVRRALSEVMGLVLTQDDKDVLWGIPFFGNKSLLISAPRLTPEEWNDPRALKAALRNIMDSPKFPRVLQAFWLATLLEAEHRGAQSAAGIPEPRNLQQEIEIALKGRDREKLQMLLRELIQLDDMVLFFDTENYNLTLGEKYPGPDIGIDTLHQGYLTQLASLSNVSSPFKIFTSTGPELAGFPHKAWGVTSRGVAAIMAMTLANMYPLEKQITVSIQGFGDVGGNLTRLILDNDDYGIFPQTDIRLTAVSDISGTLVYDSGFGSHGGLRQALLHIARQGMTLSQLPSEFFSREDLVRGGLRFVPFAEDPQFILTHPTTVFVPAGPPHQITPENVDAFRGAHEVTFEAGNIAFTNEGAQQFDAGGGVRIPAAFVNGAGVFTSWLEILASKTMEGHALIAGNAELYDRLRDEVYEKIRQAAERLMTFVWATYSREREHPTGSSYAGSIPLLVKSMARAMNRVRKTLLTHVDFFEENFTAPLVVKEGLLKTIQQRTDMQQVLGRLGEHLQYALAATLIAQHIVMGVPGSIEKILQAASAEERDDYIVLQARQIVEAASRASTDSQGGRNGQSSRPPVPDQVLEESEKA